MIDKRVLAIVKDIKGDKPVTTIKPKDLANKTKSPLKNAYIFSYERPKFMKVLPYFDRRPIVLILARQTGNKILGINLNHVPYLTAIQISKNLENKAKNKKRSLKYEDVKKAILEAKLPRVFFMVAIKSYLLDRIEGNVYPIDLATGEYTKALKEIPRSFKKMGLGEAMRLNNAKVFAYIKNMKEQKTKGK